jgi:hypothetical protein
VSILRESLLVFLVSMYWALSLFSFLKVLKPYNLFLSSNASSFVFRRKGRYSYLVGFGTPSCSQTVEYGGMMPGMSGTQECRRSDLKRLFPIMKMAVFWVETPRTLVEVYRRFRSTCCLHHQGDNRGSRHLWNVGEVLPDCALTTHKTNIFISPVARTWSPTRLELYHQLNR